MAREDGVGDGDGRAATVRGAGVGAAALGTIALVSAFPPIATDLYLPALPAVASDLAAADALVQLTLSACFVGLAAGQVFAGPLSDKLGRRRPLAGALVAFVVASLGCAAAPSVELLVGLRLAQGFAGGAAVVIARAVVRDRHGGVELARIFSALMLVSASAPVLAPLLGGQLIRFMPWQGLFAVLAAVGVGSLALVGRWLPESLPPARRRAGGLRDTLAVFRGLLGDRAFMACALAVGCGMGAMFVYILTATFVLQDAYGLSAQGFSLVFASNAAGLAAASRLNAVLLRRVRPERLLLAGLVASAAAGLLLFVAVAAGLGLPALLPPLFVAVASVGLITPNANALALAGHAHEAGSVAALLGVVPFAIGGAAGSLTGAGGITATSMTLGIAVMGASALGSYLLLSRPAPSSGSGGT